MSASTFKPQDLDLLAISALVPQYMANIRTGRVIYVQSPTSEQAPQPTLHVYVVDIPAIMKNSKASSHSIVWPVSASVTDVMPDAQSTIDPAHKKQMVDYAAGFTAINCRFRTSKGEALRGLFAAHFQV